MWWVIRERHSGHAQREPVQRCSIVLVALGAASPPFRRRRVRQAPRWRQPRHWRRPLLTRHPPRAQVLPRGRQPQLGRLRLPMIRPSPRGLDPPSRSSRRRVRRARPETRPGRSCAGPSEPEAEQASPRSGGGPDRRPISSRASRRVDSELCALTEVRRGRLSIAPSRDEDS